MIKKPMRVLALILAMSGAVIAFAQQGPKASNNMKIKEIRFEGLMNTQPPMVLNLITLKEGQNFSESQLNESIKKLFSLDLFRDVKADLDQRQDGVVLTFQVEENPYIRAVKYEGVTAVAQDDLNKVIGITEDSYFTDSKKNRALLAIQKKYIEEGFIEASVSFRLAVIDVKKNIFDLIFKVAENKKIVIEKMVLTGNKKLTEGEIKGVMKTKERFFIFQSGVLKQDDFNQDRENIKVFYQHKGYLDADVKRFEWKIEELDKDKHKAIVVYLDVTEGDMYYTGKINISGNTIFTTNELNALVNMKEGEIYDRVKMDMIRYAIFNKYSDNGHVYANVSISMNKNPTNKVIDTELVITEGPLAHIQNVTVSGNTKTQTHVVKREFLFKEGELYVQRKVRQTQEKLMQTQFFSDVKVNWLPGSAEGLIDLDIGVEEQRTGMVTFGLGYGTESGFNASITLTEKNLFGTGRTASVKGQWGQYLQSIELSFQEPWLFNNPLFAGVSFGFSRYTYNNIPADTYGTGVIDGTTVNYITDMSNMLSALTNTNIYMRDSFSLGGRVIQQFFVFWSAYLGLSTSFYKDWGANFNTPLIFYNYTWQTNTSLQDSFNKGWTFQNTLNLGLGFDSTGNPLNPLYGDKLSFDNYLVGGFLMGDVHFIKSHLSFDHYWNPFWKIVLALHGSTDIMFPQFTGQFNYNYSDMLYFDGMYEMRGWMGLSKRAESKLFLSTELRFQIFQEVWGTVFADLGNLWGRYEDWAPWKSDGYIYSFGVGVQINIPMIPIRFYMARKGMFNNPAGGPFGLYGNEHFWEYWQPVISIQGLF